MASESYKIIILSQKEYLAVRIGNKKSDGILFSKILDGTKSLLECVNRPLDVTIFSSYTDLMPINLVKFNTETETEN